MGRKIIDPVVTVEAARKYHIRLQQSDITRIEEQFGKEAVDALVVACTNYCDTGDIHTLYYVKVDVEDGYDSDRAWLNNDDVPQHIELPDVTYAHNLLQSVPQTAFYVGGSEEVLYVVVNWGAEEVGTDIDW